MSDKITNQNKPNITNTEGDKPKAVHLSPYSSFYGETSSTSASFNQPSTQIPQQNFTYSHETSSMQHPHYNQPPQAPQPQLQPQQNVQSTIAAQPKPFLPMIIMPTSASTTIIPASSANTTIPSPHPNPYTLNPYTPQSFPNDTQNIIQMKTLKFKFLRLVKLNPDVLPQNYKYKYGLYNMISGVSYVSFFLYMAYKSNFAFSGEADRKMLWRFAFRFIGGYFLISIMCNTLFESSIGPAFDQQFGGMSIPDIEKEINKIKESTVILRY